MIGAFQVSSGYALKLERLKSPIQFTKGLNILFGQNACGKSTAIKIAAAYCSIDNSSNLRTGGWSKWMATHDTTKEDFPDVYYKFAPGKCKAKLEWDGTPALLSDSDTADQMTMTHFCFDKEDSPDGLGGIEDQLGRMYGHPSSGMVRLKKLSQYKEVLKTPPDLTVIPKKFASYKDAQKQKDFLCSLPRSGVTTFFMDEPERSLSIEYQMLFWTHFIPEMASKHQVIVATHSPFALIHTDANWIDFDPEYRKKSLNALKILKSVL